MSYTLEPLDSEARARERQASRERDEAELASNAVTRSNLKRRNGFFSSLSLRDFRIVAIGGREIGNEKVARNGRSTNPQIVPPLG